MYVHFLTTSKAGSECLPIFLVRGCMYLCDGKSWVNFPSILRTPTELLVMGGGLKEECATWVKTEFSDRKTIQRSLYCFCDAGHCSNHQDLHFEVFRSAGFLLWC